MGFNAMTLPDLAGCSNHWASKSEIWVFDRNRRIAQLHSQIMTLLCNALPTELSSHLGAGHFVSS